MPRRDWRLRVSDLLAAVDGIRRYTAGLDLTSVWQTATVDVPALRPLLPALLAR